MKKEENLSFENSMKELDRILQIMENPDVGLDEQIALYEKGIKLHTFCQNYLKNARLKVEKLILNTDNKIKTQDMEGDLGTA